jgi:hypothetical protein
LSEKGRARYQHYLGLAGPKAFAITEKGGWFFRAEDTEAMQVVLQLCAKAGVRCWLYAVDDRVVWSRDAASRLGSGRLQRSAPPTKVRPALPS